MIFQMDNIAYSGETRYVNDNTAWMDKVLIDAGFFLDGPNIINCPAAVHVAFIDNNWNLLLGHEKNKGQWDFFGGKVDDLNSRGDTEPGKSALRCLYRDAFVEELGVQRKDGRLQLANNLIGYKKIGGSLLLIVRISRGIDLTRLRDNMRLKMEESSKWPTCFLEMDDIKKINLYDIDDELSKDIQKGRHQLYTPYVHEQAIWIRNTFKSLQINSLELYNSPPP